MNPGCLRRRKKRGFTLIELMVVLTLIAIMSAMILPEMRGTYDDALLRSTGRNLITAFNLAYSRSVSANEIHRVRLDQKEGRYIIETRGRDAEGGRGFKPVRGIPGGDGPLDRRVQIEIGPPSGDQSEPVVEDAAAPIFETGAETGGPMAFISFYPDGTADARDVVLKDREGFKLVLRINPTTGQVRILEGRRR